MRKDKSGVKSTKNEEILYLRDFMYTAFRVIYAKQKLAEFDGR